MRRRGIWALALAVALLVPLTAWAAGVVQPTADFYVGDFADVLSTQTEEHIVLNNDALYQASGAQIVFVTVDTTGSTSIENYAYRIINDWGVGSAEKQNGLVVLLAIQDDDYWLTQGEGLEQYLSAGDLGDYANKYLEPYFAARDYDAGVVALFDALYGRVASAYGAPGLNQATPLPTGRPVYTARPAATARSAAVGQSSGGSGGGFWAGLITLLIVLAIVSAIVSGLRRAFGRIGGYGGYPGWGWGWGWGGWFRPRGYRRPPPPPRGFGGFGGPGAPRSGGFFGGLNGAGRSSGGSDRPG
ncbi:MAG: TPM domain-containing protein, partial [Clostridiales bacterium]|nr:TPM domain-containing protein [Clostridiales bacterium]